MEMIVGERKRLLIYLGVAVGLVVLYFAMNNQPSGYPQPSGQLNHYSSYAGPSGYPQRSRQWSHRSPYAGGVGGDGRCVYADNWSNC